MRRLYFFTALLFGMLFALAAFSEPTWRYDDVLAHMQSVNSIRCAFEQEKSIRALSKPLRSAGTFRYLKGAGILWKTEQPFPSTFSISERGITKKFAGASEHVSVRDNPALARITSVFLSLFSADRKNLEEKFAPRFESSARGWTIVLVPRDQMVKSMVRDLTLRGTTDVESITLHENSGDQTQISFSQREINLPFSDAERADFD